MSTSAGLVLKSRPTRSGRGVAAGWGTVVVRHRFGSDHTDPPCASAGRSVCGSAAGLARKIRRAPVESRRCRPKPHAPQRSAQSAASGRRKPSWRCPRRRRMAPRRSRASPAEVMAAGSVVRDCGSPLSRPHRRGSAPGGVPCPVRRHLCAVLGMRCIPGNRTPAPALGAQGVSRIARRLAGTCTPPRRLPAPQHQSSRSTSQFVRWINVSTSRNCRARSSACPRNSLTDSAGTIVNSERSCRYPR